MTDLYAQKPVHKVEEENHYTELALRLIDQVDAGTQAMVANRLANYPGAPPTIVERLEHDRIHRGEAGPNRQQRSSRRQRKHRQQPRNRT